MTVNELINKLSDYPDYVKEEFQVVVDGLDMSNYKEYNIVDVEDSKYFRIHLIIEEK